MSSNDWAEVKASEICRSVSVTHSFDKDHLIFLNTGDIARGKFFHRDYSEVKLMPGQAKKSIRKNDILFSEIRPANGRYAMVDFDADDYLVSTKLMVIRANEKVLPKYLYFFLTSNETTAWLQHLAESRSGTFPQITFDHVADLDVGLPPIQTQQRIVDFISALDDKIELNRQTNAALEAIAQAIFKEWFVDFTFPGATGEMVESELGLIPQGWRVKPLDKIAEFLNGLALQKYPPDEDEEYLPVIKIRELRNGVTASSDKASKNIPEKFIIDDGDLIFSWSGSLVVTFWIGGKGALNQHLFKVTSDNYPLWFCYFWLLHHLDEFQRIVEDKTTTMGHIKRGHLSEALCLVPEQITEMHSVINPIVDRMILLQQETLAIARLRDALLPKLMNGEIEV
ncbi:MAG: restriction endonuclease subunit S [Anaerolineae bacterium]|nr:restriction endonuclease subunit S [Anaerolineae bacterium]